MWLAFCKYWFIPAEDSEWAQDQEISFDIFAFEHLDTFVELQQVWHVKTHGNNLISYVRQMMTVHPYWPLHQLYVLPCINFNGWWNYNIFCSENLVVTETVGIIGCQLRGITMWGAGVTVGVMMAGGGVVTGVPTRRAGVTVGVMMAGGGVVTWVSTRGD